jgi:hypothetical protein
VPSVGETLLARHERGDTRTVTVTRYHPDNVLRDNVNIASIGGTS